MNDQEKTHARALANIRRVESALALAVREIEAQLTDRPTEIFEATEETTLALRGKIRVLVHGLRSLVKAIMVASRNRFTPEVVSIVNRETQAAVELLTMLNEPLH